MKKFFVYILYSGKFNKFYVGSTESVEKRLELHNSDKARWTKRFQPWELVYVEKFISRGEAMKKSVRLKE